MFARPVQKAVATLVNSSAFTAKTKTSATRPTPGGAVLELTVVNQRTPEEMVIFPYGGGGAASNDAFDMRVWGWLPMAGQAQGQVGYMAFILAQFSCTVGAMTGHTGGLLSASELFVDTITLGTTGAEEMTYTANTTRFGSLGVYNPANDTPAFVRCWTQGVELIEFDIDQTTNSPQGGALVHFLYP